MKRKRLIFLFIVIGLGFTQVLFFSLEEIEKNSLHQSQDSQVIRGLYVEGTSTGLRSWELYSETAFYRVKKQFHLSKVKGKLFFDPKTYFDIVADQGVFEPEKKDFFLTGNVQIEFEDKYRFFTDMAEYFNSLSLFKTKSVLVKGLNKDSLNLTGEELSIDLKKKQAEIKSPFLSSKEIKIKSPQAILTDKEKTFYFTGGVSVDLNKYKITGEEAFLDYDKRNFRPEILRMKNQIRLTGKDVWAVASNMIIDLKQRKYIFEGNSRLLYNYTELKGEKIIFYGKTKKLEVEKGELQFRREK